MKIIVDAMGGDNAPKATIEGALIAKKEFGCDIILVGQQDVIKSHLGDITDVEIVHAEQVVEMCDDPMVVLKSKKESSLAVALKMLADGQGDALVTASNTGATLTGATLITKRIKGVRRAALAPILPTKTGGSLLVDCGANVECTEDYLEQFAIMGSAYFGEIKPNPTVALVNNGAEKSKGTPMIQKAYDRLEKLGNDGIINFIGNVEGREIAYGGADILVTDGFTGNILLKTFEGTAMYMGAEVKKMLTKNLKTKIGALLLGSAITDFKKTMDYKEVGGAPLLGIKKAVIKAHGSANAYTMRSAINQAIKYVESGAIEKIEQNLNKMEKIEEN